jgi:dTMP kinase
VKRGKLIVFEGIDGCGKSTQLARAADALRARGLDVVETREPTEGPHGRRIRDMARSGTRIAPETELEWFTADRREHMREVVEPGLEAGRIVLSDRSYVSTVAYQGARGLDPKELLAASEAEFCRPDLVLVFTLGAEEAMARIESRGGVVETAFEELAYQRRVAEAFEALEIPELERIDASRSVEEIADCVLVAIEGVLD